MNPIINKISDMSSKNRYLNKYSGDVVSATLILLILLSITAYYQAQNNLQPIRNDWENQKCKINILPISGFIRPSAYQSEKSNLEYTADNYKECMGATSFTILKPMGVPVVLPSKIPEKKFTLSGSLRWVTILDCPGLRRFISL